MQLSPNGTYSYIPGLTFASAGVVAAPGFAIARTRLATPLALDAAFERLVQALQTENLTPQHLCGVELRLPESLPIEGFREFNLDYLQHIDELGLRDDGRMPLTRTNVNPAQKAPAEAQVVAFSHTAPTTANVTSFVVSGTAELPVASAYPQGVVRPGEISRDAMREKAECVVDTVASTISELGAMWGPTADVHVYTVYPELVDLKRIVLADRGIVPMDGIVWHDTAPPVSDLAIEIDVRQYVRDTRLA